MCGIYGVLDLKNPLPEKYDAWAQRAGESLRHRGPDGHACLERLDRRCLLGHERLAIIDIAGGAQPLGNEDGSVWVVCNGEIYNYVELREQLIANGHQFRTQSDSEVLVHLYEEKGTALLDDLEGMYAFAILDERANKMFLARDCFGEKPLYWTTLSNGRGIAFASELKALFSLPELDRSLDFAAIAQFLAVGCIPAPRTHFNGVRKLTAGEALTLDPASGIQRWRYYRSEFPVEPDLMPLSREDAVLECRRHLLRSVHLRSRSDVPIAAFLSGGIDSTFVVSAIRELAPGAKFSTFCASFEDESLNEAPFASEVAAHVASDHHEVHFSSAEVLSSFTSLIDHYDEPFGDASMFPTFAVCRAARSLCTVMLSGDGGDECFGGYRELSQYHSLHAVRRLPTMNSLAGAALQIWPASWRGRGTLGFLARTDWALLYPQKQYDRILQCFLGDARQSAQQGLQELHNEALRHARLSFPRSAIESMTARYLPEQILVKVDRASMRSALECRTPFLDRSLMEFVRGLPERYHFERGLGKSLLRRALPPWVPDHIRWREKRGFTPPLSSWLRSTLRPQMQAALDDFPAALRNAIDPSHARQLFDRHLQGTECSEDLFRWLVLSRRCRENP